LNIQTELQPDHTARLIVQLDEEMFASARQKAARSLSSKVNIPGFRKGKVPLRILVNYVGEAALAEEAIEQVSQEVYRQALKDSGLAPYAPGTLVDVKLETQPPTLIYTVPLQPTVKLGDYRALVTGYTPPVVEDAEVDEALRQMQEEYALVEESQRPAEPGNRVVMALHSYFVDDLDDEDGEEDEAEDADEPVDEIEDEVEEDDHDDEHDHEHSHDIDSFMDEEQEVYLHNHEMQFILNEKNDKEVAPGFSAALVGVAAGDTRQFDLSFPEDYSEAELAGRTVHFVASVSRVETVTLPALNDDLAARVTKDEEQPLTLLEMRVRVRENLTQQKQRQYNTEFARATIDKLVETAELAYPEELLFEHANRLLEDFDRRLRSGGMTLDDYMKVSNTTSEALYEQWRPSALKSAERSLVMSELIALEGLRVEPAEIDEALEGFVAQFEEHLQPLVRQQIASDDSMRVTVANSIIQDKLYERLALIAKGEAPPLPEPTLSEPAPVNTPDEAADNASAVTNDN
jgi:trigger factor